MVSAVGTIDRTASVQLRSMLLEAIGRDGPYVVLDLAGVDHIDEIGLDALQRTDARPGALGGHFRLAAPQPAIAARLHDAGLNRTVGVYRTPVAAADAPRRLGVVAAPGAYFSDG
ncbi:MAG: STAS domain-containing protein [Acidothermales bacterium]|nr:STAS domain-containing protein [Acidothermales bacterium]